MSTSQKKKTAAKSDKDYKFSNFGNLHFTASFGQVYLRNRKRERKSTDILSKALDTIHSTTKTHQNWMKYKNSTYLLNMSKFGIWDTCRPLFEIK